ncbi:aminopeptidase P family protein [Clostridium baratii]|uniref:aminopeptidase P family protein n=1 Tax=Clostridium baratii TaxID=1561 RepID=UPI0029104373|nr:aminopeptidase P family protein [Clostridium baratii]MDU4912290.1 aminopeptidase P family protein [Clostridium baratii]
MINRINNFRNILKEKDIDAILVSGKPNKKYLGALTGSGVRVLITKDNIYQIMDGRYINEANENTKGFENIVYVQGDNYLNTINKILDKNRILGIESNQILAKDYLNMKKYDFNIKLLNDELEYARRCKDSTEIELIKRACDLTDTIFKEAISNIRVGMKEYELAGLLQYLAISKGASSMAFDTIVASGKRGCMPHGRPTNKEFSPHEFITIDFGITLDGYQSDMTRTICIDEPDRNLLEIYNIVKYVQQSGVDFIKAGITASSVDKHVRDIVESYGYKKYFTHGLGHGIGLGGGEIPILNEKSDIILEEGMVMSCEPGIYIEGVGGVRIEDDVLIKDGIGNQLNKTTKDLIILEGK